MSKKKKSSRPAGAALIASLSFLRSRPTLAFAVAVAVVQASSCGLELAWLPGQQSKAPTVGQPAPVPAPITQGIQTHFAQCPQFFPPGGMPVVPQRPGQGTLRELCYDSFAILHSGDTRTPVFVAQRLNRRMLEQGEGIKRTDRFFADARLPGRERAELSDYKGSGYSRGHMAPAGDMPNMTAMAQSFTLANMVPQDQKHNAGAWARIEADTRAYAMRAKGDVYVITGPVFERGAQRIGPNQVAVPSHLFKLVHDRATGRSWVHWQENAPRKKAAPPISYLELMQRTGLELLPGRPAGQVARQPAKQPAKARQAAAD